MPAAALCDPIHLSRRSLLAVLGGGALARHAPGEADDGFRGIFPIVATPYDEGGGVDLATLAEEVRFLDRAGVHGIVWPQLASEYALLTQQERFAGAEAIVEAAHGLRPKVVIGVQAGDTAGAVRYAEHAKALRPDAVIALPPRREGQSRFDLEEVAAYYRTVAAAADLPLFMQSMGNMSVEFVARMVREIPNLRFVKDEAGHTLSRLTEFQALPATDRPVSFTGGHGRTLLEELDRGSAGTMPAASWVDLYVRVWDLWHRGHRHEAVDMFSKVLLLVGKATAHGLPALAYVLHLRGVFPNWKVRNPQARPLDEAARSNLKRILDFVRPYLRA